MDWFSLFLECFTIVWLSVLHIWFVCCLTGKEKKPQYFAGYFFLLGIIQILFSYGEWGDILAEGAEAAALFGVCLFMGNSRSVSLTSAVLAVYVSQLSFGMTNSLEAMVIPPALRGVWLYILIVLAAWISVFLCAGCYGLILRFLSLKEVVSAHCVRILLMSGLFFFSAEIYILQTSYSYVPAKSEPTKHLVLLMLQVMGMGALIGTLYAYEHTCRSFRIQAELDSLEQAARAQKTYVAEARNRYERTRSFRHDVKNHFLVLDGLLGGGKIHEAKEYLKKLETTASALSLPCHTGNPAVDVLLGEKLELAGARKIQWEVSAILPKDRGIDDFDWCVIFANGLDNAITACEKLDREKRICVIGEMQGDFYHLEFGNTCSPGPLLPAGTGLFNIKAAAEKYRGAMLTEKTEEWFSLHVLLNMEHCV